MRGSSAEEGGQLYLIILHTLQGQLVAVHPQRVPQDGDAVALLQLEHLKPNRNCDGAWAGELFVLQAGTGLGVQTYSEDTIVKAVWSVGGEGTSTICAQKPVLIGCTKLKLYFRYKNKAGEKNPDLDLTATSAVEDFRVRVLSAHHTNLDV